MPRQMHFAVYRDTAGEWRWRLVAANGRIVADSAEGYTRPAGARAAARNVREDVALLLPPVETIT